MVVVAVAGGSGQVANEIIDALLATGKHTIRILSRKPAPESSSSQTEWRVVDYSTIESLQVALEGVHTVLSFIQILSDPGQEAQKNLIEASIAVGVKRFAPSEYGSKGTDGMAWWTGKQLVREYLKERNSREKVIEYTLFQPGLFLDYLAYPYHSAKHLDPLQSVFDFENRRALVVNGHEDAFITFTSVSDLAKVVALAVDYKGTWPVIGGIRGNRVKVSEVVEMGKRIRGQQFDVYRENSDNLENGVLSSDWQLNAKHHAISDDQAAAMLKQVTIGLLLTTVKGEWDSSDEMNQLFPDYKFASMEAFLGEIWQGKP